MGMDVDYVVGKDAIDKLEKLFKSMNHGEREEIADDIIEMVDKLYDKYSKHDKSEI